MMVREIGFQTSDNPKALVVNSIMKYAMIDSIVIFALVAVVIYLKTDILASFGLPDHGLHSVQATLYVVIAVVVTSILSALIFFFTVWPAMKEARNVSR